MSDRYECEGGFHIPYGKNCPECGATEKDRCRRAPDWRGRAEKAEATLAAIAKLPDEWVNSGNGHYYGKDCADMLLALIKGDEK